jgi:hypothetical protein
VEADADDLLTATDLPVLGVAGYAVRHLDVTIEAWERAHGAGVQAAAVRVTMHLLFDTALMAPVRGWLRERSGFSRAVVRRRRTRGWQWSAPTSGC